METHDAVNPVSTDASQPADRDIAPPSIISVGITDRSRRRSNGVKNPKPAPGVIVCIPGLGGHESSLAAYRELLPEYDFRFLRLVNIAEASRDLEGICRNENNVTLLCNCYGVQLAIRAIQKMPEKISRLIVVEAFFAEFHHWMVVPMVVNKWLVLICQLTDLLGLARRKFPTRIDYVKMAKYPIYVQPIFDIRWQNLTDYFLKIDDILTFRLPAEVAVPTLFILSPKGYLRSAADRKAVQSVFVNSDIVEVNENTHNIVSLSRQPISSIIRDWLYRQTTS